MDLDAIAILMDAFGREERPSDELARQVSIWASHQVAIDADEALEQELTLPGYLWRTIDDLRIYVPFNLAEVSPRSYHYLELTGVAEQFRFRTGHDICLSGSGAFLGRTLSAKDFDFAEYFGGSNVDAPAILGSLIARKRPGSSDLRYISIKSGLRGKLRKDKMPFQRAIAVLKAHHWNELFIEGNATIFTRAEMKISNKVFPVVPAADEPASWAYQEIVLCKLNEQYEQPRSLADRKQLSGYISHLLREAKRLLRSDTEKALKRIIALTLILGLTEEFEKGLTLLPSKPLSDDIKLEVQGFITNIQAKVLTYADAAGIEIPN